MLANMDNRTLAKASAVCYALAALLALGALLHFVYRPVSFNPGWAMVGLGACLAFGGALAHNCGRETAEAVSRERSRAELLLAEMDQRQIAMDDLADGLEVAVFICDSQATILYANRRAREMFSHENPEGQNLPLVTMSLALGQLVREAAQQGASKEADLQFMHPGESTRHAKAWPQTKGGRVFVSVDEFSRNRTKRKVAAATKG